MKTQSRASKKLIGNAISSVLGLILIPLFIVVIAPKLLAVFDDPNSLKSLTKAMEFTAAYAKGTYIGSQDVSVDENLVNYAKSLGVDENTLKEIIAGALESGIKPSHMLGFAEVETSFCSNIGQGVAVDEVLNRLAYSTPSDSMWWQSNVDALNQLASDLGVDVRSVPGSVGAGAISCFQLMPVNWMKYGGGDYKSLQRSVRYAGYYLIDAGYAAGSPEDAIYKYNPGAGQAYVKAVLTAADRWEPYLSEGVKAREGKDTVKLGKVTGSDILVIFLESFSAYMKGEDPGALIISPETPLIPTSKLVYPIPDVYPNGYSWMDPVYVWSQQQQQLVLVAYHIGQDYIGNGPVVSSTNGIVTFARYLDVGESKAVEWWISGNVVVVKGQMANGDAICTFYGHGKPGTTAVSVDDQVEAGQFLFTSGNTGFSSQTHLHFGIRIGGSGDYCDGGQFVDPNLYVSP